MISFGRLSLLRLSNAHKKVYGYYSLNRNYLLVVGEKIMSLKFSRTKERNFMTKSLVKYLYILTQGDRGKDKYREYLLQGKLPKNSFVNSRNLFDDSNKKDIEWLTIARVHLTRK